VLDSGAATCLCTWCYKDENIKWFKKGLDKKWIHSIKVGGGAQYCQGRVGEGMLRCFGHFTI
jgi:hypothetical protein